MPIKKIIILYISTFAVFLLIDMLWLGIIAKNFYQKQLGSLLKEPVNWTAAFIFYMMFVCGILIFTVMPALNKNSMITAVMLGMLFGLITYATYDLTNLATLKNWPVSIVVVDMIWGTVLTGLVSISSFFIGKLLLR